jgi:uncharacterized protein YraI
MVVVIALLLLQPERAVAPTPTPGIAVGTATLHFITSTPSETPTATITGTPTASAIATETPTPSVTPTHTPVITTTPAGPDAAVQEGWVALNLRAGPGTAGSVLATLTGETPLIAVGRTEDSAWIEVITPADQVGWVSAEALALNIDPAMLPVTGEAEDAPQEVAAGGASLTSDSGYIANVTSTARQIHATGLAMGNNPRVFAKVGDSITDTEHFLRQVGWGNYNLRAYSYLRPAVTFFTADSYSRTSHAARGGWTAWHVLGIEKAEMSSECRPGEMPLLCEYRLTKPAAAIIMLGTNDSGGLPVDEFNVNMRRIVELTIEQGVIPVLSTIPPKDAYPATDGRVNEFNDVIRQIARDYDVPLIDLFAALQDLPHWGLDADGVHLTWPSNDYAGTCDFTDANLQAGYTVRNLVTLQMLDALWRYVLDESVSSQPVSGASAQTSQPDDPCYQAPPQVLSVGATGSAVVTVNVRSEPAPSAEDIGDIEAAGSFVVIDGPTCAEGLRWWLVDTGRVVGWAASGISGTYWLTSQ